jgi:peroxiredoxin
MRSKPVLFALGFVASLSLTACATSTGGAPALSATKAGLPDFELPTVDGDAFRLSDHLGKSVIVMAFWDTWCEPCKSELPHLNDIYRAHKDQGLLVLAISMDDPTTTAQVAPYVKRSGYTFPVLLDRSTQAANLYNIHKSAPYTVVIDRNGHIASEKAGFEPGSEKNLEAELVKLLAASPAS